VQIDEKLKLPTRVLLSYLRGINTGFKIPEPLMLFKLDLDFNKKKHGHMKNRITFILIALIIVALSVLGTYSWLKQTAQLKSAEDAERIAAMKKLENSYYTNLSIVKTHYNIIDFNAFLNNLLGSTNYQAIR
jgi:hypothetical protein